MIIDVLLRKHKKLGGVNIFTKQVSVHVKTTYAQYIISMLLNHTSDLNRVFRFCLLQRMGDLIPEADHMIIIVELFEYQLGFRQKDRYSILTVYNIFCYK